jgi:membrane-bound lysozyme inhibitor of c-type lysozyme MliC
MKRCIKIVLGAAVVAATTGLIMPANAQSFQTYRCVDGTQFILGFYPHDPDAYLQIDGNPVTLRKRVALSGERYSGRGVTVRFLKSGGISVKHARRKVTACELM